MSPIQILFPQKHVHLIGKSEIKHKVTRNINIKNHQISDNLKIEYYFKTKIRNLPIILIFLCLIKISFAKQLNSQYLKLP